MDIFFGWRLTETFVEILEEVAREHQRNNLEIDFANESFLIDCIALAWSYFSAQKLQSFVAILSQWLMGAVLCEHNRTRDLVIAECRHSDGVVLRSFRA